MKYKSDLAKPFDEATAFLNNIETQLNTLCNGASRSHVSGLSLSLSATHFHGSFFLFPFLYFYIIFILVIFVYVCVFSH